MVGDEIAGSDWSDQEVAYVVADYFDMLALELRGVPVVKSQRNDSLRQLIRRSRGSIEYKHQNISAVLRELGLPWIIGYKPRENYQGKLIDEIDKFLSDRRDNHVLVSREGAQNLAEDAVLYFEAPPIALPHAASPVPILKRLVQKFDPAARDARNRKLGRQGEEIILRSERVRLSNHGRADLATKVRWVSELDGDGEGYDILSYELNGSERLLEVKTTPGHQTTPFYISANERDLSAERPDAFRLVRVYDVLRTPRAFQITPPLEDWMRICPTQFRASFGSIAK